MIENTTASTRPVVRLLHGLSSTPQEFGLIAPALRAKGVDFVAVTIPGYTNADPATPVSWRVWLDSAAGAIESTLPRIGTRVIGGLCTGSLIAAALILEGRLKVDGLVLLSPTFAYDGWGLTRWRHLRALGYWLGLGRVIRVPEREPYGIKSPRIRQWVAREMRERTVSAAGPSSLPLWALRESERLTAYVRAGLRTIETRTLVIHARDDEITRLASVEAAFLRVGTCKKQLIALEDSYHMITMDNDRHRVVDELAIFAKCCNASLLAKTSVLPTRAGIDPGRMHVTTQAHPFETRRCHEQHH